MKPSDLLLTNGILYTVDKNRTVASAMAVKDDTIVYIGDDKGAAQYIGDQTRVIDLQGKLTLPGFIDSHNHAVDGTFEIFEVMLHSLQSVDEYKKAILDFMAAHPGLPGILGGGWMCPLFPPQGPDKKLLDGLTTDIPIVLWSEDYHSVWVNSKALQMAGITRDTPNPEGGIIEKDENGNPNGTLRETAANLVEDTIPAYTVAQRMEGLKFFQNMAHSYGITTVHVPGIDVGSNDLQALRELQTSGELTIRFRGALRVEPTDDLTIIEELVQTRDQEKGKWFEITTAKIFMDGVIEGGTAYLEQPYSHKPHSRGDPVWEAQKYNAMCAALEKAGFQIHVHSIGDAATRVTLDGFDYARNQNGPGDWRHIITHLHVVNPEDIQRCADLNVVAVVQPFWFLVDCHYFQMVDYLGQERADRQYPMKSFFDCGVVVASASDYNVTIPPNPLDAIEAGITRKCTREVITRHPEYDIALNPSEAVSLEDMIASYTINGAYANFLEDITGSLEIGKKADFIVLDKNLFDIPAEDIHNARVVMTFFEGQEVYHRQA
ncbi:MAG: amidohydrolase [Anaerolineales bacterium]|nr:amidohydrolase [Anaerolineales bacterium]